MVKILPLIFVQILLLFRLTFVLMYHNCKARSKLKGSENKIKNVDDFLSSGFWENVKDLHKNQRSKCSNFVKWQFLQIEFWEYENLDTNSNILVEKSLGVSLPTLFNLMSQDCNVALTEDSTKFTGFLRYQSWCFQNLIQWSFIFSVNPF